MGDSEPGQSTPLQGRSRPAPPRLAVDVVRRSRLWRAREPDDAMLRAAARAAVGAAAPDDAAVGELAVVLADDAEVRALNRAWRGRDTATNVLSFPLGAPANGAAPRAYGDVVLAYETVAREAGPDDGALASHAVHLVVHGVLHLLGYDHESETEARRMEALETRILADLGMPDPYAHVNG